MSPSTAQVGFAKLLDWHEGRLTDRESVEVEKSLDKGGALVGHLHWLESSTHMRQGLKMAHIPSDLMDRLYEQFESRRRDLKMVRCFVATLSFDSRLRPEPALVRNGSVEGLSRQLVYNTELADVALSVCAEGASGDCMWLQGQLLWRQDEESEPLDRPDPQHLHIAPFDHHSIVVPELQIAA
jgi:hypothetical protein